MVVVVVVVVDCAAAAAANAIALGRQGTPDDGARLTCVKRGSTVLSGQWLAAYGIRP